VGSDDAIRAPLRQVATCGKHEGKDSSASPPPSAFVPAQKELLPLEM
jgi:hypothetical protein